MTPPRASDQLTVIFDGACDFCTATRRVIERRDRHDRLAWVPCQAIRAGAAERHLCGRTVVTITPEGTVDTGARAIARIATTLTGSPWPIRIASLPVLRSLLALGYHGFARVRRYVPGDRPWCEQHPDDCRPDA